MGFEKENIKEIMNDFFFLEGGVNTLEVVAGREALGRLKSLNPTLFCVCASALTTATSKKHGKADSEKKMATLTLHKCVRIRKPASVFLLDF